LLIALNPIIRGWAAYYRAVVAKEVFASCDYHLMSTLRHWAGRRHNHKSWKWVFSKYWRRSASGRLEFSTPTGLRLVHHADTPIQRHVKVRGTTSPFNGDLVYWSQRLRQHPLTVGRMGILLKRQRGRCAWCGSLFLDRAEIEVDHVQPRVFNGHTDLTNLQLLHRHCHDQKSVLDGSATRRRQDGVHAKNRETEEPNAGKLARSALQTSRTREGAA
jgi:RNA-directed DNA polymerase